MSVVDDLQSLIYVLVEFLHGSLPWRGKEKDAIGQLKAQTSDIELCHGLPDVMLELCIYVRELGFGERVDYDKVWGMIMRLGGGVTPLDVKYDWQDNVPEVDHAKEIKTMEIGEDGIREEVKDDDEEEEEEGKLFCAEK